MYGDELTKLVEQPFNERTSDLRAKNANKRKVEHIRLLCTKGARTIVPLPIVAALDCETKR